MNPKTAPEITKGANPLGAIKPKIGATKVINPTRYPSTKDFCLLAFIYGLATGCVNELTFELYYDSGLD